MSSAGRERPHGHEQERARAKLREKASRVIATNPTATVAVNGKLLLALLDDADALDKLDGRGVETTYWRDGWEFNPGSQTLRAALRDTVAGCNQCVNGRRYTEGGVFWCACVTPAPEPAP